MTSMTSFTALLSRRMTVASVARAVQAVARRGRKAMMAAMYQASAKSPTLALAIAEVYPVTLCAHTGCLLPIAHEGGHPVEVEEPAAALPRAERVDEVFSFDSPIGTVVARGASRQRHEALGTTWPIRGDVVRVFMTIFGRDAGSVKWGAANWPGWGYVASVVNDTRHPADVPVPETVTVDVPLARWNDFVASVVALRSEEEAMIFPNYIAVQEHDNGSVPFETTEWGQALAALATSSSEGVA